VNMPGFGLGPTDMSHLRTSRVIDFSSSWPDSIYNFQAVVATIVFTILFVGPATVIVKKLEGRDSSVGVCLLVCLPTIGCVLGCITYLVQGFDACPSIVLAVAAFIVCSCLFSNLIILLVAVGSKKFEDFEAIVLVVYWWLALAVLVHVS